MKNDLQLISDKWLCLIKLIISGWRHSIRDDFFFSQGSSFKKLYIVIYFFLLEITDDTTERAADNFSTKVSTHVLNAKQQQQQKKKKINRDVLYPSSRLIIKLIIRPSFSDSWIKSRNYMTNHSTSYLPLNVDKSSFNHPPPRGDLIRTHLDVSTYWRFSGIFSEVFLFLFIFIYFYFFPPESNEA